MRRTVLAVSVGFVLGCAGLDQAAQGVGVPPEKQDYVGSWVGDGVTLVISPEGDVDWERQRGENTSSSLDGPITRWEGEDFVVGIAGFGSTFDVTEPPHEEGGAWKMGVEGVELTRQ